MKINTKVIFEWNDKSKQYEEIHCESYEYDGEVANCLGGWEEGTMYPGFRLRGQMTQRGFQGGMFGQGGGTQGDYGQNFGAWLGRRNAGVDPTQNILSGYEGGGPMNFFQNPLLQGWDQSKGGGITGINRINLPIGKPIIPETFMAKTLAPSGPAFDMTSWDAANPNPPVQPLETAEMLGDFENIGMPSSTFKPLAQSKGSVPGAKLGGMIKKGGGMIKKGLAALGGGNPMLGLGALINAGTAYKGAQLQKKAIGTTIKELNKPLAQWGSEYESLSKEAKAYRPGGEYSQYAVGKTFDAAGSGASKAVSGLAARGIDSASMSSKIAQSTYSKAAENMPGVIMDVAKGGAQYDKMAMTALGQMEGLQRDIGTLRGVRARTDPMFSMMRSLGTSMFNMPFMTG